MKNNTIKQFLFFFVHPSKYYLFRYTINHLKRDGHKVDIAIVKKDVLEYLVQQEGWDYINIFPEGRQSKREKAVSIIWKTVVNFSKTLIRLHRLTKNKKYDLFITDDCLVITGWYRRVKTLFFIDNELSTVPESAVLCYFAFKIIAPLSVNLGRFEKKKIGFRGYKELAYLHPDIFTPDVNVVKEFNPEMKRYFVIRLVSMTASHDRQICGITNRQLNYLLDSLSPFGVVYISAEKGLPEEFNNYLLKIKPNDIASVLYFADLFIGDSGTMASEAAVLGTPSIMYHDFIGRLGVMKEKEEKYGLMFGFKTNEFDEMLQKALKLVSEKNCKQELLRKKDIMLHEVGNINDFLIRTIMFLS
jgi:uncharacterized protein